MGFFGLLLQILMDTQGTNGPVYAITWGSSLLYPIVFGGSFNQAGTISPSNIAGWDGSNYTSLSGSTGEGTNGPVYALAVGGTSITPNTQTVIYVGGDFTSVAGSSITAFVLLLLNLRLEIGPLLEMIV